ncbi:glutamyl-Q tRNA(Asp) synthetase [Andreprevotia lacus DSM 23236]|jgi:glutamyl-Q tRNA(Asp) synthetase|uniref:Glutamyl-Q tRNA(Asp) synthetase n=1 Tax=Andreprevotia lacus DSM 23236 TaxID=1121001 RepID=A0A1W1XHY1_9NEIS|nr:tRNA glutamyl-Q(34) synthetase GluQRS [Andreprevotia lacus]SMC23595.1 glutamyl-Q tRNA(Asp) synthetase [Andreprevotia lacus DSM 23236]
MLESLPVPKIDLPEPQQPYCGRFAPSPTGDLHLGSLLAALASCLEARSRGGRWLLRMEDLDPPRVMPGAAQRIVDSLLQHGFVWDGELAVQSERSDLYKAALVQLQQSGRLYPCCCTRREVAQLAHAGVDGPVYPGTCRNGLPPGREARALRVRVDEQLISFADGVQGLQQQVLAEVVGDFVLQRADGLFAYQLAVVVDDALQGVNHVVRGADLLDSTPRQIHLQRLLGLPTPGYVHIPVLVNQAGEKLSKQTLAPALQADGAVSNLWLALDYLGQNPPPALRKSNLADIWQWAHAHWALARVPRQRSIPIKSF